MINFQNIQAAHSAQWRRQWHPTPGLLPGKSHGWRSLVGCSPWGCEESGTTEWLHFHFSLSCIGEGNGNPVQCSCLENPRDAQAAWWAAIYGVAQSWTWLKWLSSSRSIQLNTRKQTTIKTLAENLNRCFSKEDIHMAYKHIKKDAQHRSLPEKWKSKLQWGITSHQSEWPSWKNLKTIRAVKGMEKRELFCTVGGNANWYNYCSMEFP